MRNFNPIGGAKKFFQESLSFSRQSAGKVLKFLGKTIENYSNNRQKGMNLEEALRLATSEVKEAIWGKDASKEKQEQQESNDIGE